MKTGEVLHERYEILEAVAAGGMGAVYRARDLHLEGLCAVKALKDLVEDAQWASQRFREEARLLDRLAHPAIPGIRDFFHVGSTGYLVMDFVEGVSLADEVKAKGARSSEEVAEDARQVLDVLEYLHGLEPPVIHRDVKPANLIRDSAGKVRLVDFGLARFTEDQSTQTTAGTISYCPPEQLRGHADHRSDLYALGATMHHLLMGEAPMFATFPALKGPLGPVVARATQADPRKRFASAAEMRTALDRGVPRRRVWPWVLVVLLLLGAAWWAWPQGDIEVVRLPAQPTLSLREDVQTQDQIYPAYVRLLGELDRRGAQAVGAPYTRYHVWNPPRHIDMEVGITLAAPQPGGGELPGGRAARIVHHGDYSGLQADFLKLEEFVRTRQPAGPPWYVWTVSTGDSAGWVTEIYWPLK